jgi:hypothetical protein
LAAVAAVITPPTVSSADESIADALITEFYKWHPCVHPKSALEMARAAPDELHAAFNGAREERDRFAVYRLIVDARLPGYERVIRAGISDRLERIRACAIHDLHLVLPQDQLITECIRLLDDPSPSMRYYAAEQLAERPSKQAIEPLLKRFGAESVEARHRAAATLVSWNGPDIKRRMRELSHSNNPIVAGVASSSLAHLPGEQVNLAALHSYLQEMLPKLTGPPYSGVDCAVYVIRVIDQHGDASSLRALRMATKHQHPSVQEAAVKAIENIKERGKLKPRA